MSVFFFFLNTNTSALGHVLTASFIIRGEVEEEKFCISIQEAISSLQTSNLDGTGLPVSFTASHLLARGSPCLRCQTWAGTGRPRHGCAVAVIHHSVCLCAKNMIKACGGIRRRNTKVCFHTVSGLVYEMRLSSSSRQQPGCDPRLSTVFIFTSHFDYIWTKFPLNVGFALDPCPDSESLDHNHRRTCLSAWTLDLCVIKEKM